MEFARRGRECCDGARDASIAYRAEQLRPCGAGDASPRTNPPCSSCFFQTEKDSFLWRLHYSRRYFAHRKGLVKLDFIQSNCDPEEALKRLKSSTGWSKLQDDELRRCLKTHMDLLKEHEMSKMDAASGKSEYENVALEKINMELGSELDEELGEFDWSLMGLYYSRTKLRNLARECAIQCQAQTTGVFLVEEALPVRGYLKEHMLSASPKVRKLPFMKKTVKQLLEGGMGSLRGITEQFGRGAARGKAWQILAYGTVATVAFVEDRRQGGRLGTEVTRMKM